MEKYQRLFTKTLQSRLNESVSKIILLAGPRQVGKTTGVNQILERRKPESKKFYAADNPVMSHETSTQHLIASFQTASSILKSNAPAKTKEWLVEIWKHGRNAATLWYQSHSISLDQALNSYPYVLVIDEIHVIKDWSSIVKGLWDEDRRNQLQMHVVILGSSPLLMQKGLTESLAGRFETIAVTHWSFDEMHTAFGFTLNEYIYFGGYPGPAQNRLICDYSRWISYMKNALIDPNIQKDVLAMARVEKPALLKQLFTLACSYSGQMVGFDKLKGQLNEAGNTTTLTHYLNLLEQAGLIAGLSKYSPHMIRQRAAPPKLNVLNTAFQSLESQLDFEQAQADHSFWGRLVESAIGAHLINTAPANLKIAYWRESPYEVDFVLHSSVKVCAVEVKSNKKINSHKGLSQFKARFQTAKTIIAGGSNDALEQAMRCPAAQWLDGEPFQ